VTVGAQNGREGYKLVHSLISILRYLVCRPQMFAVHGKRHPVERRAVSRWKAFVAGQARVSRNASVSVHTLPDAELFKR
jgi:hypothetical protein